MTITVTCGQCAKTFKAPDAAAGRKAKCSGCGMVIAIPKPAAAAVATPADDDPMAALAGAVGEARKPVVPQAVVPQAVAAEPVEPQQATPPEETEGAEGAEDEQDELVAVPPIGVQTPTGLSAGGRALKWHRRLAGSARTAGFALGGVCLVLGISGMIVLALRGRSMLMPALGVFLALAVMAAALAMGGLLARHVLLMLADLGNVVHRQQELLDEINERLD